VTTPVTAGEGRAAMARMEEVVADTGGLVTNDANLSLVVDALRSLASDIRTPEARRPMRSVWWLLPLVCCLAGEWWLRRRAGLR